MARTVLPTMPLFTRRERITLAALIDEPSTVVARRFGTTPQGQRMRKMRAMRKLEPEQREHYERSLNRRKNRTRKTAIGLGPGGMYQTEAGDRPR